MTAKNVRNAAVLVGVVLAFCYCAPVMEGSAEKNRPVAGGSTGQGEADAIQAWLKRYCDTVTAGDFEGYRAFWTEDVIWMPPNSTERRGIVQCMEYNRPLFERYTSVETMTALEIKVDGDCAFARVNYTYNGTPKPGVDVKPRSEDGKGVFLLRRRPDGSWVSTHCIWNSNQQ